MKRRPKVMRGWLCLVAACGLVVGAAGGAMGSVTQLLPETSSAEAQFGTAVAVQDGLAVIGAPRELDASGRQAGAVYVRSTDGALSWRLTPSDADARYQFGRAVALDADVIVVGAWQASYVFRFDFDQEVWVEEAKLEQSCSQGKFGSAVAVSGDRLLVGSPHIGCLQVSSKGYAFFYRHTGNGVWEMERRFGGDIPATGNYYGWSVAIEGDLAAVGSPHSSRVNVYRHNGTSWVADSTLSPAGGGWDIALRDGRLVVGMPSDNTREQAAGAACVFRRNGTSWISEGKLLPPATSPTQKLRGSYYGTSVGVSGTLVVLGGPQADVAKQEDGAVLVYELKNGVWTYRTRLTASDAASYDYLGTSVDIDGQIVVAGAPGNDAAGTDAGAAYVFTIPPPPDPNNQPPTARWSATRDATNKLTLHFDASLSTDSDGQIVGYQWDFGDGNTGSGVKISHTYAASGTYWITLTVTDNGGATGSLQGFITVSDVNMLPVAKFGTLTANYLTVSVSAQGSYDPDGSIVSYDWDFGDGQSGSGRDASHTYAAAGTYTITLTVTDNEGGQSSLSRQVTVTAPPEIALTATGYKVRGLQKADLAWSGAATQYVNIYFSSPRQGESSGVLIATVPNTGAYTHHIDRTRGSTYKYWVCEVGTDRCSNVATVVFQ